MDRFHSRTLWGLVLLMIFGVLAATISADDDEKRHQHREGKPDHNNHHKSKNLMPISNAAYADQCGTCHFAYQPELLPAESWRRILAATDEHFGERIDLDPKVKIEIDGYLASKAADTSSAELARKIMQCLNGSTPLRITEIPIFRKKHHKISPLVVKRPSVRSLSNCSACHRTAEKGVYDDEAISIPE